MLFFDTSAIVPLLIKEPSTALCRDVWERADRVAVARLAYVEIRAALASARRQKRISAEHLLSAHDRLQSLWGMVAIVEVDDSLTRAAGAAADRFALRGHDAMQFVSAHRVPEVVPVSGDRDLLHAWLDSGLPVIDTHQRLNEPAARH